MKRFSAVLVSVLVFVLTFSSFANAASETRTEKFFDEIEKSKAVTFYEPMKNEDMFILLCRGVEQTPEVAGYLRDRAAYLRNLAEKNRPGMVRIWPMAAPVF